MVSVLLLAFMPSSAERLLAALGREDPSLDNAALRGAARRRGASASSASSSRAWSPPRPRPPSGRRGPPGGRHPLPPGLLRAPGRLSSWSGRGRPASRGWPRWARTARRSCGRWRPPASTPRWRRSSVATRTRPPASARRTSRRSSGRPPIPSRGPSARRASTTTATTRRATTSAAPSRRSSSSPRGSGCRWPSTPGRRRTTRSRCCASTPASLPAVILHCFSAPERLDECVERGYLCSFAGNVTYPKADGAPGGRAAACPPSCCSWRPTRPTSRRSRCAASRTSRPT